MVSMVEFFATDVAIGGCNQLGIALHLEVEIVVGTEHAAPFPVDSIYADVLQIGAVGKPMVVVDGGNEPHRFARCLYAMDGSGFCLVNSGIVVGASLDKARLVLNVLP